MIGPTALCPRGIGLVFVDLDDTVLADGTRVSARVLDAISLARERGCMVCVSSGRALNMVPELLRSPQYMDYLVCANGSCVYDSFGGTLHECLMAPSQVLAAMDAIAPLGAGWNAFIGGHSYFEWRGLSYMVTGRVPLAAKQPTLRGSLHTGTGRRARDLACTARRAWRFGKRMLFDRQGLSQVRSVRPYIEAAIEDIAKVGVTLSSSAACERAMAILVHMGCFEVARMGAAELEVTAKGATKGAGARWLMDYLKIDPACAVAFGDSENDVPLADACGTFVAVGNGDAHVLELADDVCESVYDDGVARWLERVMAEADGAKHV